MGLEQITPATLGKEKDPKQEALIKEYEEDKKKVEKLFAEIHKIEETLDRAA